MPKPPLERTIVKNIDNRVLSKIPRCYYVKLHGGAWQKLGLPDFMVIWRPDPDSRVPCVCFLEVKRPGNDQTPIQKLVSERLARVGLRTYVVRSSDEARAAIKAEECDPWA